MPILVQWKWVERTKSFLVIFHFYDDYSKRNLRLKKKKLTVLSAPEPSAHEFETEVMTWAPSHPETGLLSELLSYANIVNGLKESEKRELRMGLEIAVDTDDYVNLYWYPLRDVLSLRDKAVLLEYDGRKTEMKNLICCVELCPEYIDHLKRILKPYISN